MKDRIHQWYQQPGVEDGDFFIARRIDSFDVIPPMVDSDTVLYCTKKHCISRFIHLLDAPPSFRAISRYGLPSEEDVDWLRDQVGQRRFLFWGDADPADLLHFAWLREHLQIEHVGMSDQLLSKCKVAVEDNYTIELRQSELAALPLVTECLGDLAELLGPLCAGLLNAGRKIEMEALLSFKQCTPQEMESALLLRS